jgi:hypothetical protein
MAGRNGTDQLNRFLAVVDVILLLLSLILPQRVRGAFYTLFLVVLVITYFRMLSKNLYRRRAENNWYLQKRVRVAGSLRVMRECWLQRKEYRFFACPSCSSMLRVPKGRGKIKIVCRKCGTSFVRKT